MKIAFETDAADATKTYADECWREDPRVSPDSWRLSHGWTLGKLWADGREGVVADYAASFGAGMNGLLVTPETWPEWRDVTAGLNRSAMVVGCEVSDGEAVPDGVDFVLWVYRGQDDVVVAATFGRLEQLVQQGALAGYGLTLGDDVFDVSRLWMVAQAAAAEAWGRRKRPAWRMLGLPLGVGSRAWLERPVCALEDEMVSGLEWAARQDFLVIVQGADVVRLPGGVAAEQGLVDGLDTREAMARMVVVADAEVALMQVLQGWPQRGGVPVFSLMEHLQTGVPLWPGAFSWDRWREDVWPGLQDIWQGFASERPDVAEAVGTYLKAWEALDACGGVVARVGAEQWRVRLLAALRARAEQDILNERQFAAAVIAGIPGVTGVAGPWMPEDVRLLMETASHPDMGYVLGYTEGS